MKTPLDVINDFFFENYGEKPTTVPFEIYDRLDGFVPVVVDQQDKRRWFITNRTVVKVGDHYIAYGDAETSGDLSASETGWEFELDTLEFVYPTTVTTVQYLPQRI